MQFSAHQTYAAPAERVHDLLTDETFLASVATRMGATRHRVAATPGRTAIEATIDSPPDVRSFVGSTLTLTQETVWGDPAPDGSRDGTVSITVDGTPASATGVVHLARGPEGCTLTYDGDLTVRVPLLGPRIEKAAAPAIHEALAAQARAAADWFRDHPA